MRLEIIDYREKLHAKFCIVYSHIQLSEQKVADQYRVIVGNNFISETKLNSIKREAEREIHNHLEGNNELYDKLSAEIARYFYKSGIVL